MSKDRPPVCDYDGSDYQTAFWEKGGREYEDQAEAVALERLMPKGGSLLLEVGAGAGRNTLRYHGFERIVLLDYSMTQLQQAQARLGRSDRFIYVAASVYKLPFVPGLFDSATMIRTLHHMADAPRALSQVRQVLIPGGVFILEFANKRNVKSILRYILRRQSWSPFTPDPIEFAALNYDFHPATIREWLTQNGLSIERQLTVSHFRIELLKRWLPVRLLVKMDSIAQLTGNMWQLSPSVFVRARAVGENPVATSSDFFLATSGDFFRCPECGSSLREEAAELVICSNCAREWQVCDGIYNFREPGTNEGK